jgi:hypothetical protein
MMAIAMLAFPLFATAQMAPSSQLDTKVPFNFLVGNRFIPAGECIVKSAGRGQATITIQNVAAKVSLFSLVTTAGAQKGSEVNALIFHRYGNDYFLAGVKLAQNGAAYALPQGKLEAELRAQNVPETEEILLAAVK